ncbi:oligopeptide ABC transporter permease OppC [Williamsoniiplasma lucivorax]|uniref:Oligopeptide ABC transporter permease n=1 Tax=Williamsoniiplasma lucivorax TaxID=209274 RepID=A0A2S5REN3_9MOLU|nr:oligopeptide ABC transporter permease OppC [Williamsoniiplasma lucivorax]PPE05774.1 oligopeptide ABC transporter permease [Williamsoniiplasma lucivorax]
MKTKDNTKFINNDVDINKIDPALFKVVGAKSTESEVLKSKPYSYWKSVFKLLVKSPSFIVAMTILIVFIILAIAVPWGKDATPLIKPNIDGITGEHTSGKPHLPTWEFLFGLGVQGEDLWLKMWAGMRTTLAFAFVIAFIQIFVGILIGSIWGYFRKTDIFFIQLTNLLTLVPSLILLLFVVFMMKVGLAAIIIGVSIQAWIAIASTVRVQIILVKNTDYNTASVSLGSGSRRIITKNIMPKILPVIIQAGTFAVPNAISIDATLSFLGFGFTDGVKTTSLGKILNEIMAKSTWEVYPHLIIIPLVLTTTVSIIFFVVAKVFADSLDPKNHR